MPPLMPAAKLSPTGPSRTATPPVMYSQPLSPQPSTTVVAPELRPAKRSPARAAGGRGPARGAAVGGVSGGGGREGGGLSFVLLAGPGGGGEGGGADDDGA